MPKVNNKLAIGTENFGLDCGINNINDNLPAKKYIKYCSFQYVQESQL